MTDLTALPSEPEDDDQYRMRPGKSTILMQFVEDDSHLWPGLSVEEMQYEGGSAEIENEGSFLEEAIESALEEDTKPTHPGWWVMEGFYGTYTRGDGWTTDDDAEFECDVWRPARWSDIEHFGIMAEPLWVSVARLFGFDPEVNTRWACWFGRHAYKIRDRAGKPEDFLHALKLDPKAQYPRYFYAACKHCGHESTVNVKEGDE